MPIIPELSLTPKHLADLRASGLSDATIAACGFRSLQALASIQAALGWKQYNGELGACLAFRFFDADGKPTGYTRLKPDHPRSDKKTGKPIKYESPVGLSNRAYFPPRTLAALHDPLAPLVITEGEKKAAKSDQEGFACIGLVGVYGWQKKRDRDKNGRAQGERELIDDLASIPWQGRPVFIAFDSDAITKPDVRRAEWHLAEALARAGAIVKVVRLPQRTADGKLAKVGLDDFLVADGPDAFLALLSAAVDPTPPTKGGRSVGIIARPASAIQSAPVDWLWPGRIPCGALTVLDGDPGLGKSTVTLALAARVSRGDAMPPATGQSTTAPANVIIFSAEDDPARTIRPRLEAAGADLERIQIVEAVSTEDEGDRLPVLPLDLPALEQFIAKHQARLVIIDPIMGFLGDEIDAHKDQSIRRALHQFSKLTERAQCAFLIVRHLNKMPGGAAMYRGGGSIGIIGAARSGLLLAHHPEDPTSCVLASTKSNLGPPPRSIVVSIANQTVEIAGTPTTISLAAWDEECDLTADELLGSPTKQSKVEKCVEAIRELLAGGRMKSADFEAALKEKGFKPRTIKTARKAAEVKATKSSFDGEWWVELPTPAEQQAAETIAAYYAAGGGFNIKPP